MVVPQVRFLGRSPQFVVSFRQLWKVEIGNSYTVQKSRKLDSMNPHLMPVTSAIGAGALPIIQRINQTCR
jgi:hypothetical protein